MQTLGQIKNFNNAQQRNRMALLNVERLETRLALSGSHATMAQPSGTITGRILNEANGHGLGQVTVQLSNANGQVVATTHTGPRGRYAFHVKSAAPYVVHAVTPRRFIQTSPTFANTAPT